MITLTLESIILLMISDNNVQIVEGPYAEWDGDYRKEFNTWLSK